MAFEKAYPGSGTEATEVVIVEPVGGATVAPGQPSAVPVYTLASAAQVATFNSGDLAVSTYSELQLAVNITAITGTGTPTATLLLETKGADGVYYSIYAPAGITTVSKTIVHIGTGCATNVTFGSVVRLTVTITGTTPSFTMSASIIGK